MCRSLVNVCLLAVSLTMGNAAITAPHIAHVSPPNGSSYTRVTIAGRGLGDATHVVLQGIGATRILNVSDSAIVAIAGPSGAADNTTCDVSVTLRTGDIVCQNNSWHYVASCADACCIGQPCLPVAMTEASLIPNPSFERLSGGKQCITPRDREQTGLLDGWTVAHSGTDVVVRHGDESEG